MSDLRSRLHAVVDDPADGAGPAVDRGATAIDDVLVSELTARVRRRRVARTGAAGAVGALAVAAVAIGGSALAGGGPSAVSAADDPTAEDGAVGFTLECGEGLAVEAVDPSSEGLALTIQVAPVADGRTLEVAVELVNEGTDPVSWDARQQLEVAALREGVVVATATVPVIETMASGGHFATATPVELSPCGPEPLDAGDYELVGTVVFANHDGSDPLALSAGPLPFSVVTVESGPTVVDATEAEAQALVDALLAGAHDPGPMESVGDCGTRLPGGRPDGPAQFRLLPASPVEGADGAPVAVPAKAPVALVTDASLVGVRLVLARDGVVVGNVGYDAADLAWLTTEPGEPATLPAVGAATVCLLEGSTTTTHLPAGTYQLHAIAQVGLPDDVVTTTDEPGASTVTITFRPVVSDPLDVTVPGR